MTLGDENGVNFIFGSFFQKIYIYKRYIYKVSHRCISIYIYIYMRFDMVIR